MNSLWLWFWEAIAIACLLWYSLATVYIAIRGAADIRGMLKRLKDEHGEGNAAAGKSP